MKPQVLMSLLYKIISFLCSFLFFLILERLLYLLVQLTGNAVLQNQQQEILSLRMPFAALTALWGKPGFYLSAGLIFLGATNALAGILRALGR